ncbi:MAG: hypothetical protein QGH83_04485, partial [Candidatus Pacebacteria bacterium]|nr:hypothetical protein [Candidatus Paceibacterota bacterium]
RLNLYFKGGDYIVDIPWRSNEYWAITAIQNTHSFKDVVDVAKQLQIHLTENPEEENPEGSEEMESCNTFGILMDSEDGDSEEDWDNSDSGDLDGDMAEDMDEEPDPIDFDQAVHGIDDAGITTQEAFEENQSRLSDAEGRDRTYFSLPKPILKNIIVPHKRVRTEMKDLLEAHWKEAQENYNYMRAERDSYRELPDVNLYQQQKNLYNRFRSSSSKIINYMVKEFERRKAAEEYKRTSVSRTGVINVNKLHAYKYAEDIFLKRAIVNDGKNHGLILLVDWSASMHYNLHNTIKQTLSLVWFCNKIQIPFEVYAFTDSFTGDRPDYENMSKEEIRKCLEKRYHQWEYKAGDAYFMRDDGFKLLNLLSSRMSARELNMAALNLWQWSQHSVMHRMSHNAYQMGATPTVEALMAMTALVPAFKEYYKLDKLNLITLTDGDANSDFNCRYSGDPEHPTDPMRHGTDIIYVDPFTGKNYMLNKTASYYRYWADLQTDLLLRVLKDRFDINTIGIYVDNDNRVSRKLLEKYLGWYSYNKIAHQKKRAEIRQNGFCTITTAGFDEYYIIPLGSMKISDDTSLPEDAKGISKGKLKTIFAKNQKNKFGNRVLANRMMDLLV